MFQIIHFVAAVVIFSYLSLFPAKSFLLLMITHTCKHKFVIFLNGQREITMRNYSEMTWELTITKWCPSRPRCKFTPTHSKAFSSIPKWGINYFGKIMYSIKWTYFFFFFFTLFLSTRGDNWWVTGHNTYSSCYLSGKEVQSKRDFCPDTHNSQSIRQDHSAQG